MANRFRVLSEPELAELDPPALLAYVHAARAAGELSAAKLALQMMMWGHRRLIRAIVGTKVPEHRVEEVTDFVIAECAAAIVRNPPDAENELHFRGWLSTVVRNQTVSWWRKNARHEEAWSLDGAGTDDDGSSWEPPSTDGGYEVAEYGDVIDRQFGRLSKMHQRVVRLRVFEQLPSKDVAARMSADHGEHVSPVNVDKIASRFRQDCRLDTE